eukprot:5150303-Karenia_brevis.AAC.1
MMPPWSRISFCGPKGPFMGWVSRPMRRRVLPSCKLYWVPKLMGIGDWSVFLVFVFGVFGVQCSMP